MKQPRHLDRGGGRGFITKDFSTHRMNCFMVLHIHKIRDDTYHIIQIAPNFSQDKRKTLKNLSCLTGRIADTYYFAIIFSRCQAGYVKGIYSAH